MEQKMEPLLKAEPQRPVKIKVEVVKEKSFDPTFHVKVHYESEALVFRNAPVAVVRRPPKVMFTHPPEILEQLGDADQRKVELEIMNRILEHIMQNSTQTNIAAKSNTTFRPNRGS